MIRGLFTVVGGFGRLVVPLGLFAVLAVGLHAGADRVDDEARFVLDALDARLDAWGAAFLGWLFSALEVGPTTSERWTFAFVDLIDLDTRDELARVIALIVELVADLVLAVPLFLPRPDARPYRQRLQVMFQDPTLLRWVGPLSAALASWAGVLTITRELQVASYAGVEQLSGLPRLAELMASLLAALVLLLVVGRLMSRVCVGAVSWAERVAERDRARAWPPWRRRLRGWGLLVTVFPITVLAVLEAGPLLPTLRALFAVG